MYFNSNNISIGIDERNTKVFSLVIFGKERLAEELPLFYLGLSDKNGNVYTVSSDSFGKIEITSDKVKCANLKDFPSLAVDVKIKDVNGELELWYLVRGLGELVLEYIDFSITLPSLRDNLDGGGEVLYPFNEGAIVRDIRLKDKYFPYEEPIYPSKGSYSVFPNMLQSQMMAYLFSDCSLYIGAHDKARGLKGFDFFGCENGVRFKIRLFSGSDFGKDYATDFPLVISAQQKGWEECAERYRKWFESSLLDGVKKIADNTDLPKWYEDSPLVVSYPIRGAFDTDKMNENMFYPYVKALPTITEIQQKTDSKILVLLMHWEGTAPWAPPYVWPPYGGENALCEFKNALAKDGNLLGVYCSGFGYTLSSNLVSYDMHDEYEKRDVESGVCRGRQGEVKGVICENQRKGLDLCPCSDKGKEILDEAYLPLLESGLDYIQILDQNHGGGQYLCYSSKHNHPPVPGKWMTENMQKLLKNWNTHAPNTLLGCESASAEPFISNLLFSDNRFELNYKIGEPVPLYSYIYHEYLRNFMGNQVSCPFRHEDDTLPYRLAYSFCSGDCLTLVLSPYGYIMPHWGRPDSQCSHPDKDKTLKFIKNLVALYKTSAKDYLYDGRMIKAKHIDFELKTFSRRDGNEKISIPTLYYSAWKSRKGDKAQIVVNPQDSKCNFELDGVKYELQPLSGIVIPLK